MGDENAPTYERVVSPYGHKKHLLGSFNTADLLPPRTRLDSHVEQPIIVPMLSSPESEAGSFIFDNGDQSVEQTTERTSTQDEPGSYDLKAPPPAVPLSNAERLALSLFSVEHLNLILRDQTLAHSFAVFLNTYRPRLDSVLVRYQEAQKAIAALKYANALTENAFCDVLDIGPEAASLGPEFEAEFQRVTDELVSEGLSAYVSHKLVQIVTECLVKEVTGNQMPHMQGLASGVAETYCMTDPNLPDNPIVYASEGTYLCIPNV